MTTIRNDIAKDIFHKGKRIIKKSYIIKLKDKPNRSSFSITNQADSFFVAKGIEIRKIPTKNNEMEITLYMPDPNNVQIIDAVSPKEEKKPIKNLAKK